MKILYFIGGALCAAVSNIYVLNRYYNVQKKDNGDK